MSFCSFKESLEKETNRDVTQLDVPLLTPSSRGRHCSQPLLDLVGQCFGGPTGQHGCLNWFGVVMCPTTGVNGSFTSGFSEM
jgi:hypothetical protein